MHMLIAMATEVLHTRKFHLWTSVDEVGIINTRRKGHLVQGSVNGRRRGKEESLLVAWILMMEAWQAGRVTQVFLLDGETYGRKISQMKSIIQNQGIHRPGTSSVLPGR
jgi:hypothetical protein